MSWKGTLVENIEKVFDKIKTELSEGGRKCDKVFASLRQIKWTIKTTLSDTSVINSMAKPYL